MKKRFNILTLCIAITLSVVATFQMTYVFCARRQLVTAGGELSYNSEKLAYIDEIYRKYFVGEIDEEELTDIMIRAYLSGAGERFGGYMTAEEMTDRLTSMQGEVVGVGIHVYYPAGSEYVQVVAVMEGSPAEEAGMLPGDYIYAVDGKSATELGYAGILSTVAGKEGTDVTITVLRDNEETVDLVATRRKIEAQSVYSFMYSDGITGIIRITSFNANTPKQFTAAVDKLTALGMKRVVFDLRGNPGGELNSVSTVLDNILPEGDIIIATDKAGNKTVLAKSGDSQLDIPMAALVDGGSASAAELFAGCFRDYEKGPLIGETTYGKGSMQTIIPLPDGSGVSVTYRKFTSPSGFVHDGIGFTPDIEVTLAEEYQSTSIFLLTEEQDTVLGEAIKYLNGLNADN